jgi:thiamine-monophosphate kinase
VNAPPRSEDALIAELRTVIGEPPRRVLRLGIGDDAAIWRPSRSNESVITTDALVEDVHFTAAMAPEAIGHRALAANLSDIAAMGARPVLATIALGVNARSDDAWIVRAYRGMAALAKRYGCALAGGDITRAPAITFAITVVGEVRASNVKRRDGARPGDAIFATAGLGLSHAGLLLSREPAASLPAAVAAAARAAYETPEPQVREGRFLGASRNVRAMMDTSDGLSTDLARLCAASAVGAVLERVPVHPLAELVAAARGDDGEAYALGGGEDFALVGTARARAFHHLASSFAAHFGRDLLRIGTIVEGAGVRLADGSALPRTGWDHLRER